MRWLLLMLVVITTLSCDGYRPPEYSQVHYFKDPRTGICFAGNEGFSTPSGVMTYVPCKEVPDSMLDLMRVHVDPNNRKSTQ